MTRVVRAMAAVLLTAVASLAATPGISTAGSAPSSAVTRSVVASRSHLEDGAVRTVDSRSVTMTVSKTRGLVDRERVRVSWRGAHPTYNPASDIRSTFGKDERYPFVILQCRGRDDASLPADQRVSPETCFTQNTDERYFPATSDDGDFPVWRLDRFAPPSQRSRQVGVANPLPEDCRATAKDIAQYWLHFRAPTTTYLGGFDGCAGFPPEAVRAASSGQLDLPGNAVYGVTDSDGSGSVDVDVRSKVTNASLGCTDRVACSLVAVPVMGISCDRDDSLVPADTRPQTDAQANAAAQRCEASAGSSTSTSTVIDAVRGAYWWAASNWRNRMSVPLSFQPLPGACDAVAGQGPVIYGSELFAPVSGQWQTKFCLDRALFPFKHVQTGEPLARTLLKSGSVQADLTSFGDGVNPKPTVTAPVALGGFGIGFAIDFGNRPGRLHSLKLNARLLAKLMSESYPGNQIHDHYLVVNGSRTTPLAHNPRGLFADPEFVRLNPSLAERPGDTPLASNFGPTDLGLISANSDLIRAVTSYIAADADARAWLGGKPDPDGMVVNPTYQGIDVPRSSWPLLDSWAPGPGDDAYKPVSECVGDRPIPLLPLRDPPVSRLATLSQRLEYPYDASVTCTASTSATGGTYYAFKPGGLFPSDHALALSLTTLSDAARFGVDIAALQTKPGQFATPSDAGLRAAAALLKPSATTPGLWSLDYAAVVGGDGSAYPGLMPVHLQVPAQGLPTALAKQDAALLRFAAGPGQVAGSEPGQLPPGFLPLPDAQHGRLSQAALAAAKLVEAQGGGVPVAGGGPVRSGRSQGSSPSARGAVPPSGAGAGASTAGALRGESPAAGAGGSSPSLGGLPNAGQTRRPVVAPTPTPVQGTAPTAPFELAARTRDQSLGAAGLAVPGLLVLALVAGMASRAPARRRA